MNQQRSRRHHIVPQVLQRQFCREGKLWYSEGNDKNEWNTPELRTPRGCFWRRNYYNSIQNGAVTDEIETKFYQRVDNVLGQMLPFIISTFEVGKLPEFKGHNLSELKAVVYEMVKRTPDFTERAAGTDFELGQKALEEIHSALLTDGSDEAAEVAKILTNRSEVIKYGRTIRARSAISRSARVDASMEDMKVRWAKIDSKASFIIGSVMCYRVGNGGSNGLQNPNMELWMPISPKIALILLKNPPAEIKQIYSPPIEHVRQINLFAKENSWAIASHSGRLLRSLLDPR